MSLTDGQTYEISGEEAMMHQKDLMKISEIDEIAANKSASFVGEGGPVPTLPIPVMQHGRLKIVFLYYHYSVRHRSIYPPVYELILDASTAELEELKAITPDDYGVAHKADEAIGTLDKIPDNYIHKQQRLYELYDILLPYFMTGMENVTKDIKITAKEFKDQFQDLSLPPLNKFYRAVGKDFFSWLDRIAQQ